MSRKIDRYMNKHGKPATQCVVQHVRDLEKKLDLSREERSVVLNQCLDKALRDRFYFEEDNKEELEKEEIEEHMSTEEQKDEEAGFKKASEVQEDEQESEEEQSKGQTLSDLIAEG